MRIKSMSRPGSNKTPGKERVRNNSGAVSTTGPNSETSSFIESAHGTEEGGKSKLGYFFYFQLSFYF